MGSSMLRRLGAAIAGASLLLPAASSLVVAATPTDLFISEYLEGSSNNKAIELYNGTGAPIDLAAGGYVLNIFANGGISPSTITLSGTVADGSTFVIANPSANPVVVAVAAQTAAALNFNGNDAVELDSAAGPVDLFGTIGMDPGLTGWGAVTTDHDLVRKSSVTAGRTVNGPFDPTLEWDAFPNDTFTNLGSHTIDTGGGGGGGSDTGVVDAQITVPSSAACIQVSTTGVDFGTLPPGSEDQPGSPDITVTNCSALDGEIFARGTDASATGAHWSLVDSTDTCAGALGVDNYRLGLEQSGAETGLATTNKSITTLASGASDTRTGRIFSACPGSTGSGTTMTFQLIFLATTGG